MDERHAFAWIALLFASFGCAPTPPSERPVAEPDRRPPDPILVVAELAAEYDQVRDTFLSEMRSLTDLEERKALAKNRPHAGALWTPRFWEIADAHPTTEAGFQALDWIRSHSGDAEEHHRAVALLLEHHLDHPNIGSACRRFIGAPHPSTDPADEMIIRKIMEESPHARARAEAGYCLARVLLHKDREANEKTAIELLERTVADGSDVPGVFPYEDRSLAEVARLDLLELRRLRIDGKAPEISGEDIDGIAFDLSDYAGKVVLLDFWGHW